MQSALCNCALQTGVLAVGGWASFTTSLSTCTFYDCVANRCTSLAPLNTARQQAAAATHLDVVFVFGGWNGAVLDTVEQYDATANKWTVLPTRLTVARRGLAAAVAGSHIYVVGGYDGTNRVTAVDRFDVFAHRFDVAPPLRSSVVAPAAAAVRVANDKGLAWLK